MQIVHPITTLAALAHATDRPIVLPDGLAFQTPPSVSRHHSDCPIWRDESRVPSREQRADQPVAQTALRVRYFMTYTHS